MPIGVLIVLLGLRKPAGGGTCLCVAEPGYAHSGMAGLAAGACPRAGARSKGDAMHSARIVNTKTPFMLSMLLLSSALLLTSARVNHSENEAQTAWYVLAGSESVERFR